MSRQHDLTTSAAVFETFDGVAGAACEIAAITPLTLRLLHARNITADLMRAAEAEIVQLQHSIHLARQCGEHPVSPESLEAETLLRQARALLPGGAP